MKHILRNIFFYANIIVVVALVTAYLAPVSNPETFIIPALFGLAFPYIFIANLLFIIYWISFKNLRFIFSLVAILAGWNHMSGMFQFNIPVTGSNSENEIKIMSYNVRLFDLYNWTDNIRSRNKIFNLIKIQNADILCFQEFYYDETNHFNTLDTIIKFQKAKNTHTAYTYTARNKYHFGIATFTKYPIVKKGRIEFQSANNICIFTDIKISRDTFRIYNCHLESIHFQPENYNFIDSIGYKNEEERLKGIKDIVYRLKSAYAKRAPQVDIIADHIKNSPFKVIVCGDFNDTPVSYTYDKISSGLKDSFRESGLGFGSTYNSNPLLLRIDYILHDENINTNYYKTIRKNYSDHYPIIAKLDISGI